MTQEQLASIVDAHQDWLQSDGKEGKKANFKAQYLDGLSLDRLDLRYADFQNARFYNTTMRWTDVSFGFFWGADMPNADLIGIKFHGAKMMEVNMRFAYLHGSDLSETNLTYGFLQGAHLNGADLRGAKLEGTYLTDADLREANLGNTKILQLGPLGSRKDYLVVKRFPTGETEVMTGCFRGTLLEFEDAVLETYSTWSSYYREYRDTIDYIRGLWGA